MSQNRCPSSACPRTACPNSSNLHTTHCLHFAAHAHTIATCFAVEPRFSSNPSLSLNPLLGTLSCSFTPYIHLDKGRLMTTIGVSKWMNVFLLVPAHLGCPGQHPESRKTGVCVCVCVCVCVVSDTVCVTRVILGYVCMCERSKSRV